MKAASDGGELGLHFSSGPAGEVLYVPAPQKECEANEHEQIQETSDEEGYDIVYANHQFEGSQGIDP